MPPWHFMLLVAVFAAVIFPTSAAANATGDFNGDGAADLAVGVPDEDLAGLQSSDHGIVHVIYGSRASGLTSTGTDLWNQSSVGIADTPEPGDRFGHSVAAGDLNGDGFHDLAIGVPGESLDNFAAAGAVHVLYGSPSGLTGTNSQLWHQGVAGIQDGTAPDDRFGRTLAIGDFGGSSHADLAVGIPGEDLIDNTVDDAGAVHVIYGSGSGLTSTGNQFWHQDSPGVAGGVEAGDQFGSTLAAADFGGSARADLAIGIPREDISSFADAGAVSALYGSASGLTSTGNQLWDQDAPGMADGTAPDDRFGSALAVGNFGASSHSDLAVGIPREDLVNNTVDDAGAAHVIYGSASGLTSTGNQFWQQDSPGIGWDVEADDRFGWSLAAGDFGGSSQTDLAIGVPFEELTADPNDKGYVQVIPGSTSGLTGTGSFLFGGLPGASDFFGISLASGDFGHSLHADLVTGSFRDLGPNALEAGGALVSYGAPGLLGGPNQFWSQDSAGIPDTAEHGDRFATHLGSVSG
jgi:FG-GAP repeat